MAELSDDPRWWTEAVVYQIYPRSFRDAASAQADPLADALFAVEGVTNVLINGDWVTVNKTPQAEWKRVKRGIEKALKHTQP